ncbi:MAG TPA: hypothetical protein VKZ18_00620 [Polyangia bacterium]|nr:hypothetical protein [Polyangia bacterium]
MERPGGFALLIGLYRVPDAARREEIAECLRRNLANEHIDAVHVFLEESFEVTELATLNHPKVLVVPHLKRATYRQLFDHAGRHLSGRRTIIANNDIYFDHTLGYLAPRELSRALVCLTRWDVHPDGSSVFFEHSGSQDAWIFRAPLVTFPSDWYLGLPGCDNRLAHEAAAAGLKLLNPARSVRIHHLHLSGVRSQVRPRVPGRGRGIEPGFLDEAFPEAVPPAADGAAEPCAEVAFHETMGYVVERLVPGASSHCNSARPFRAVPAALHGQAFTQVVSGRVSPVEVEFRTDGSLYVLCGTDWKGGQDTSRELAKHGYDTLFAPLTTAANTAFDVFRVRGTAGQRMAFDTQVMLVAKALTPASGGAARAPADGASRVLLSVAQPGCGFFSMFFRVLGHLRLAEREALTPVVYFNRHVTFWNAGRADTRNAWEYVFQPVSELQVRDVNPEGHDLERADARALQKILGDRAIVRGDYLGDDIGYAGWMDERQRDIAANLVERYVRLRPELQASIDAFAAQAFGEHPVAGVHYRGTDKVKEAKPPAFEGYRSALDAQIAACPELRIFVATDCGRFLDRLKAAYGERVFHRDARRSYDGRPIHFGYGGGPEEVVADAVLLSRTRHLLHGISNVSAAALAFNRALGHTQLA